VFHSRLLDNRRYFITALGQAKGKEKGGDKVTWDEVSMSVARDGRWRAARGCTKLTVNLKHTPTDQ
jgi:hypothetical protein